MSIIIDSLSAAPVFSDRGVYKSRIWVFNDFCAFNVLRALRGRLFNFLIIKKKLICEIQWQVQRPKVEIDEIQIYGMITGYQRLASKLFISGHQGGGLPPIQYQAGGCCRGRRTDSGAAGKSRPTGVKRNGAGCWSIRRSEADVYRCSPARPDGFAAAGPPGRAQYQPVRAIAG